MASISVKQSQLSKKILFLMEKKEKVNNFGILQKVGQPSLNLKPKGTDSKLGEKIISTFFVFIIYSTFCFIFVRK